MIDISLDLILGAVAREYSTGMCDKIIRTLPAWLNRHPGQHREVTS